MSQCHSITRKTISPQSARHVFPSEFSLSLTEFAFFIAEPSLVIAESSLVMTEPSAFIADPSSLSRILNMFNGLRPISSTESPKMRQKKIRHCKNGVTSILRMGKIVFCTFAGDFLNLFWPQALKFMQKRVFLKHGSRYDAHFNRTRTGGGCIRFNYIERLWGRGDFLPWVSNTSTPYISLVYLYFSCSLGYFLSKQNSNVLQ